MLKFIKAIGILAVVMFVYWLYKALTNKTFWQVLFCIGLLYGWMKFY